MSIIFFKQVVLIESPPKFGPGVVTSAGFSHLQMFSHIFHCFLSFPLLRKTKALRAYTVKQTRLIGRSNRPVSVSGPYPYPYNIHIRPAQIRIRPVQYPYPARTLIRTVSVSLSVQYPYPARTESVSGPYRIRIWLV